MQNTRPLVIKIHKHSIDNFLFGLIILYAQEPAIDVHIMCALSKNFKHKSSNFFIILDFCPLMIYDVQEHAELNNSRNHSH